MWAGLSPGPHAVGFKSLWRLDYSRRYNMTFPDKTVYARGKAPRPILVNQWYPAGKAAGSRGMPHRDYLSIRSEDPQLATFSARLSEYVRAVLAVEVMGKPPAALTDREKAQFEQVLTTPTACVRDAPPARGPFPLVIYHAGAGSSFEDNAVLCEYLASHGFVVLGSAFQVQSGESFNTDNRDGSARDLDFLITHARQLPNVDWDHIGLVGHSAGAQAALVYGSQPHSVVDAVVSLDTTQDYRGVNDPMWQFTPQVLKNARHFRCPLLVAAGPHAFFELADSLRGAERYYLTLKDMDHNDYISQGCIHREQRLQLRLEDAKQSAEARAKDKAALDRARAGYSALCGYTVRFLSATLKRDAAGKEFLAKQYRDTKVGGDAPHVDYVPEGRTEPDRYKDDAGDPPTPRQVRPFLRGHGSKKTIAVLRRFRKSAATHPIFTQQFELFLVSDLLDQGRAAEAVAFRDYYRETGLDCGSVLFQIGKGYQEAGLKRAAAANFRRVLLLDPSNKDAAGRLQVVEEGK